MSKYTSNFDCSLAHPSGLDARLHASPVHTGRMHGRDGEKALRDKLFGRPARASGWPVRTGRVTKNHARTFGPSTLAVCPGRTPGYCAPSLTVYRTIWLTDYND